MAVLNDAPNTAVDRIKAALAALGGQISDLHGDMTDEASAVLLMLFDAIRAGTISDKDALPLLPKLQPQNDPKELLKVVKEGHAARQADLAAQRPPSTQPTTGQTPAPRVGLTPPGAPAPAPPAPPAAPPTDRQPKVGGQTVDALKEQMRKLMAAGNQAGALTLATEWFRLNGAAGADAGTQAQALMGAVGLAGPQVGAVGIGGQPAVPIGGPGAPAGGMAGGMAGGVGGPPPTSEEARREQFGGTAGGRRALFQDVMRGMRPGYDYQSAGLRSGYESRLPGLEATYYLDPAMQNQAGSRQDMSFQDFLRSGRAAMTPDEIQAQISRLGGFGRGGSEPSNYDKELIDRYAAGGGASDQEAFDAMMDPYLQNRDPAMRQHAENAARLRFQKMRLGQPNVSFAQQLNEMGGRFF